MDKDNRKLISAEMNRISAEEYRSGSPSGIVVVLDNIRSAHNVGSVFRTSDAFKADLVCLCGICATPPMAEIHKTALGAEDSVPWKHFDSTADCIEELRGQGYTVISIEQTHNSVKLDGFTAEPGKKYALVFGNEVDGVQQAIVDSSDFTLEIPQFGTKHSLNVSVSAGVILWHFVCGMRR